ncbi:hypothetical protein MPTK1_4g11550 [Marchantia polymorpha subsp. ruderalis]|uniref:Uncharacterized protein n=2 Tax=Marchantia polymorpha TaxID=3197 RepID=A0AAF6B8U9_MARPO|nr:hypothetical protein MARPO_0011s0140 [Marchantia polymorpha]BBN08433.1 hypothetical protein Mp_4g11550 [Marchantia polymorpha subsp. ruderalis]|eukprot:PTQ46469.1 hypothetical protein MARPO_0011s0140 [Marchantia polymorpha]
MRNKSGYSLFLKPGTKISQQTIPIKEDGSNDLSWRDFTLDNRRVLATRDKCEVWSQLHTHLEWKHLVHSFGASRTTPRTLSHQHGSMDGGIEGRGHAKHAPSDAWCGTQLPQAESSTAEEEPMANTPDALYVNVDHRLPVAGAS